MLSPDSSWLLILVLAKEFKVLERSDTFIRMTPARWFKRQPGKLFRMQFRRLLRKLLGVLNDNMKTLLDMNLKTLLNGSYPSSNLLSYHPSNLLNWIHLPKGIMINLLNHRHAFCLIFHATTCSSTTSRDSALLWLSVYG
ncbi:hypothetical protein F2Q70_00026894 [Brassica cretica]|uniref:Uncharacterized protein n=1 Tax=Brassica cretica TaxID=69181 RepID=A0A8S9L4S3_BRACR|nr:hypothetical protein F2Q70_00026894 [Brassica cretica]